MTARGDGATTRQGGAREGATVLTDADGRRWPFQECVECGRVFNLLLENDADEWAYGHDCES